MPYWSRCLCVCLCLSRVLYSTVYSTLQCNALQCNVLQCSALQCIAVHCSALQCIPVHCSALQRITAHYSALQCIAVHCSELHRCAVHAHAQSASRMRMRGVHSHIKGGWMGCHCDSETNEPFRLGSSAVLGKDEWLRAEASARAGLGPGSDAIAGLWDVSTEPLDIRVRSRVIGACHGLPPWPPSDAARGLPSWRSWLGTCRSSDLEVLAAAGIVTADDL